MYACASMLVNMNYNSTFTYFVYFQYRGSLPHTIWSSFARIT